MNLKNKKIVVTGACGDIGSAIVIALKELGAVVISVDIEKEADFVCDLSNSDNVMNVANEISSQYPYVHGLVNCAGFTCPSNTKKYSLSVWKKSFSINLDAPFLLMQALVKRMGRGSSIVNITSLNAELAFPNNPAYISSKGALKQLTKSFALDLGNEGIRVNNVGPGYIKTKMTKTSWDDERRREFIRSKTVLKRWGKPEDLTGIVCFLLSDASSYITGQDIYVDGGWSIKGF